MTFEITFNAFKLFRLQHGPTYLSASKVAFNSPYHYEKVSRIFAHLDKSFRYEIVVTDESMKNIYD